MAKPVALADYLANNPDIPADLSAVVMAMCDVGKKLSRKIARGALEGAMGAAVGDNTDGDVQKALDVIADEMFFDALQGSQVRWYASEEREEVIVGTAWSDIGGVRIMSACPNFVTLSFTTYIFIKNHA